MNGKSFVLNEAFNLTVKCPKCISVHVTGVTWSFWKLLYMCFASRPPVVVVVAMLNLLYWILASPQYPAKHRQFPRASTKIDVPDCLARHICAQVNCAFSCDQFLSDVWYFPVVVVEIKINRLWCMSANVYHCTFHELGRTTFKCNNLLPIYTMLTVISHTFNGGFIPWKKFYLHMKQILELIFGKMSNMISDRNSFHSRFG